MGSEQRVQDWLRTLTLNSLSDKDCGWVEVTAPGDLCEGLEFLSYEEAADTRGLVSDGQRPSLGKSGVSSRQGSQEAEGRVRTGDAWP